MNKYLLKKLQHLSAHRGNGSPHRHHRIVGRLTHAILFALVSSLLVILIWNNLLQGLFGLQVISYWQAFGLLILVQMVSFMFRYRRPETRRETATDCID
jgi:hypothetical protein